MSSSEQHTEGAKPHATPTVEDPTFNRSAKLAIASQATTVEQENSQRDATSPLLRLPAELRNHIFALALTHGEITWSQGTWPKTKNLANLLFICRQTYAETALLPYSLNTFVFVTTRMKSMGSFLERRTPAQIQLIHELSLRYVGSRTPKGYLTFPATNWMTVLEI